MLIEIKSDNIRFENFNNENIKTQDNLQVYLKGYFEYQRNIYRDSKAATVILKCWQKSPDDFDFNAFNGCYLGWIYDKACNRFILFNDRFGIYPLYYSYQDNNLILSDCFTELKQKLKSCNFDNLAIAEILCGKYTSGERTTLQEIKSILPGTSLDCKFPLQKLPDFQRYWLWEFTPVKKAYTEYAEEFLQIISDIFDDFSTYITSSGKPVIVPTSGGYDSRMMISELSARTSNVSGLVFGAPGCDDLKYGVQIVEGLNLPLKKLYLKPETYQPIYQSDEFDFVLANYNSRGDSHSATLTSLLAIDDNDEYIIIPGHSLDMQTGGHIRSRWHFLTPGEDFLVGELFRIHYNRYPFPNLLFQTRDQIEKQIRADIHKEMHADESTIGFAQRWDMENRQAKFIVNAVREYEVKGYEWMMPGWDYRIQDFFLRLPFKYQFHQNFYLRMLSEHVFDRRIAGINKKTVCGKYEYLFKHIMARLNPNRLLRNKSNEVNKPVYPLVNPHYIHKVLTQMEIDKSNPIFAVLDYDKQAFKDYIKNLPENVDHQYSKVTFYHLYRHLQMLA